MRLGLVSCTAMKTSWAGKAKEVYGASQYFAINFDRASHECGKVMIPSALHGLVDPEEHIEPYEIEVTQHTEQAREQWRAKVALQLSEIEFDALSLYMAETYLEALSYVPTFKAGMQVTFARWAGRNNRNPRPEIMMLSPGAGDNTVKARKEFTEYVDKLAGIDSRDTHREAPKDWLQKWIWDNQPVHKEQVMKLMVDLGYSNSTADYQWGVIRRWHAHEMNEQGLINKYKAAAVEAGTLFEGDLPVQAARARWPGDDSEEPKTPKQSTKKSGAEAIIAEQPQAPIVSAKVMFQIWLKCPDDEAPEPIEVTSIMCTGDALWVVGADGKSFPVALQHVQSYALTLIK